MEQLNENWHKMEAARRVFLMEAKKPAEVATSPLPLTPQSTTPPKSNSPPQSTTVAVSSSPSSPLNSPFTKEKKKVLFRKVSNVAPLPKNSVTSVVKKAVSAQVVKSNNSSPQAPTVTTLSPVKPDIALSHNSSTLVNASPPTLPLPLVVSEVATKAEISATKAEISATKTEISATKAEIYAPDDTNETSPPPPVINGNESSVNYEVILPPFNASDSVTLLVRLAHFKKERNRVKNEIKKWSKQYEKDHGKLPDNAAKSSVKALFVAHKVNIDEFAVTDAGNFLVHI